MTSYNFSKTTNFTASIIILSELQNDVNISSISSASLIYIDEAGDTITFFFSGALSGPDQTTLSNICTNYVNDPRPTATSTTTGDTSIAGGLGIGANLWLGSPFSATNINTNGSIFHIPSFTYTSTTVSPSNVNIATIDQITIAETNASTTVANAASFYIANAPTAGSNVTSITNAFAMYIAAGRTYLGGPIRIPTGASNGFVLTSDGSGNASWSAPGAASFAGFADGTAALPGAYFTSQPGTGFYRPGSGQIGVELAGANYATFTTTGLNLVNGSNLNVGSSGSTSMISVYGQVDILGTGTTTASSSPLYINPASTAITGASNYFFSYFNAPVTVPTTFTGTASTVFIAGPPTLTTGGTGLALNVTGNVQINNTASSLKIFTNAISNQGTWIDLDMSGPSGIGVGGVGSNTLMAYASFPGAYFEEALVGDFTYRNGGGRTLIGTNELSFKSDLMFNTHGGGLMCSSEFNIFNTTRGQTGGLTSAQTNDFYGYFTMPFSDSNVRALYFQCKYTSPVLGIDGISANGTNLTITGGVTYRTFTDVIDTITKYNPVYFNNGTGAASQFLQSTSLGTNLTGMTSTVAGFSISFWSYTTGSYSTVIQPLICLDTASGASAGVIGIFRAATTGTLTFVLRQTAAVAGTIYIQATESAVPAINRWTHYVLSFSPSGTVLYKNGVVSTPSYSTGNAATVYRTTTITRFTIGAGAAIGTTGTTGALSNLIFSSTIWTASQVALLYAFQSAALKTPNIMTYSGKTYLGGDLQIPTGAAADLVLTSDNLGNATWQVPTIPYYNAIANSSINTTSTTLTDITSMTLTPLIAGTYMVTFTTNYRVSNANRTAAFDFALNGTQIANTLNTITVVTANADFYMIIIAFIAFNGTTDAVTARFSISNNSLTLQDYRSINAVRVSA